MKINELFKEEYIGKKVIDNKGNEWIINNDYMCDSEFNDAIQDYYCMKTLLELEFEFIEEPKTTGWERVGEGEKYFAISTSGNINFCFDWLCKFDNKRYVACNYFSTKEKAEEVEEFQLELRKTLKYLDTEIDKEIAETFKKDLLEIIENIRDKDSLLYKSYGFDYNNKTIKELIKCIKI